MADIHVETQESLASRHRQEKKELQAKIQALKKTVTKGDKKKKKEVQEEIAKLESDLAKKHEEETAATSQAVAEEVVEDSKIAEDTDNTEPSSNAEQRVSKAQKRRNKKAAAVKEREVNIKEQEKLNLQGPRHKESATIKELLKVRGLTVFNIPADGNCLYKAVEHQLEQIDGPSEKFSLSELRKLTAKHLRENADNFLPFLSHPDTGDMLTPEQFEEYCRKVECTTAWGGQVELQALSNVLKRRVEVVQASGPPIILGEEHSSDKQALIVTYHRHMYRLGEHYNSVQPISNDENLDNDFVSGDGE